MMSTDAIQESIKCKLGFHDWIHFKRGLVYLKQCTRCGVVKRAKEPA